MKKIQKHSDLKVYQLSFEAGMEFFEVSKCFPKEERYSLIDQIRRSSRSVSGNLAEAWRKRRYSKTHSKLFDKYDHIIAMIVNMVNHPEKWKI